MTFPISSALLDACVLSIVNSGDTYGYMLTQAIKTSIGISESGLYPVLRRLQKDGCLSAYDVPYSGRLRRYYSITHKGIERLELLKREWSEYKESLDKLINQ